MTVAKEVQELAARHGVAKDGYPDWLADQLNRFEGVEGDETLTQIASLRRDGIISVDQMNDLALRHIRELGTDTERVLTPTEKRTN